MCAAPLFYEEHEQPYDFFRYTQFAHWLLFSQAGFQVERVEWLEGFFGTFRLHASEHVFLSAQSY